MDYPYPQQPYWWHQPFVPSQPMAWPATTDNSALTVAINRLADALEKFNERK